MPTQRTFDVPITNPTLEELQRRAKAKQFAESDILGGSLPAPVRDAGAELRNRVSAEPTRVSAPTALPRPTVQQAKKPEVITLSREQAEDKEFLDSLLASQPDVVVQVEAPGSRPGTIGGALNVAASLPLGPLKSAASQIGSIPVPTGGTTPEGRRAAQQEVQEAFGFDPTAPGPREPIDLGSDIKGLALTGAFVAGSFAEPVIEPLDFVAESAFSLAKLQKPKGYTEALENFRDRSVLVQIALGLVFDPFIALGVLGVPSRASRAVIRAAVRAELAKSMPGAPKRVLDAATELATTRIRNGLSNERGGISFRKGARDEAPAPTVVQADGSETLMPPVVSNIINLQPIQTGLSRSERIRNLAATTIGKPFKATPLSDISTPAIRERTRVQNIIDTQGNILGSRTKAQVKDAFDLDGKGRIVTLDGVDASLPSAPTIQDVAARLPRFIDKITPQQLRVLRNLEAEIEPYLKLFDELGIDVGVRTDITEGGFYLPRGNALIEGSDEVLSIGTGRGGAKKGFERGARFESMAQGLDANFTYAALDESLEGFAKDAGSKALDEHLGNFFKSVRDADGKLIGETPKVRLLRQNPVLAATKAGIDKNLTRLKSLLSRVTDRQQRIIDDFINNPDFDDIDELRNALVGARVSRGPSTGAGVADLKQLLARVKADLKTLAPEWKAALKRARETPRGEGAIDLSQLNNRTFPLDVANAANAVLAAEKGARGPLAPLVNLVQALNNLYRGLNATLDNSALGIQGLLGLADDQKAYAAALRVNLQAWGKGGDASLGKFLLNFDDAAASTGRLRAVEWGQEGLRVGGQDTEYMLGTKSSLLSKIPGVRQANRAFGYFGDTLRLQWADDELEALLKKGKSLEELRANGDVRRIAEAINGTTGWSPGKTFGNMGDLVLFAPRFMQSRLETVTRAVMSLQPGSTIEQRIARRSLLKLIGYGTLITVAANELLGEETDFRPIVNGRYNSNFMRIRFGGRDWSVFGTWDFIPRAIISTATGNPQDVLRSSGSGIVSGAWDLISNESFVGEPVRDNPLQFGQWILEHMTPFAFEEIPFAVNQVREGEIIGAVTTIAGEATGAKSSPLTGREATDVARKAQMDAEGLTGEYEDLPPAKQVEIDETSAVSEAKEAWQDQQRERQSQFRAYADERDGINEVFAGNIAELAKRTEGPSREFRVTLGVHQRDRARDQALLKDRSSEALEFLQEKEPGKAIESQALDAYAEALFDSELEDPVTFEYNFPERERRLATLRQRFGDDVIDGVESFLHRNENPLAKELREDRETLKSYWEIREHFIIPRLSPPAARIYEVWLDATPIDRAKMKDNPVFADIINGAERQKVDIQQAMRKNRPEIATALLKWEYSTAQDVRQLDILNRFQQRRRELQAATP